MTPEWMRERFENGEVTIQYYNGYIAGHHDASRKGTTKGEVRKTARRAFEPFREPQRKRAPSTYNKRYAAEYKRQKAKHPRSSFASLSKKTHKALKRRR